MAYRIYRIALSENGWTNNFIAAQWFERCFLPQAKARNTSGKAILLIYDGHKSHETIELRETAVQHNIELYRLPAHTSHRLQPLDVGVFGPLQRAWQKQCASAMDDSGEGITRQQVVKKYMAARTESFKETTILSAWRKSGISPLNPGMFTAEDFGPSIPSSFKAPLPNSFPMPHDGNDPESLDNDHVSVDGEHDDLEFEGQNKEGEGDEDDESEQEDRADRLNQDINNDLPFLAQTTTITPSLSTSPPSLALNASTQPPQLCLSHEEGGEPPSCMEQPSHSSTNAHRYNLRHQTHTVQAECASQSAPLSPPNTPKSVNEQLAERVKELENKVDVLEAYCVLSGDTITRLQKRINSKENKKKTSARAKKTTGEARVLTSEEGRQELQQLREETQQKEQRQNEELARKAAEDQARCKCRADPTHTFTGSLNKSRRKEELADIAAALSLSDSGKKDDLFERIMQEFEANPDLKTKPRFEGLFQSRPRKRARIDDTPSSLIPPPHPGIGNGASVGGQAPGPSGFTYEFPLHPSIRENNGPTQYQLNSHPQYPYIHYP